MSCETFLGRNIMKVPGNIRYFYGNVLWLPTN
jgi:hypothetical protein